MCVNQVERTNLRPVLVSVVTKCTMRSISSHIFICLSLSGLVQAAWVKNVRTQSRTMRNHKIAVLATVEENQMEAPFALWTEKEVDQFAEERGVVISFSTLGPGYRAVARAKHDETIILGYVEGFVRPAGQILHLDKMEVFKPVVERVKRQVPESLNFGGISFGVGLLMGYTCLLYGKEKGCRGAEFLAIDDEVFQHKRLVRYYKRVGFRVVKYVGDGITDIPDRLVWGGCGTLMREDIDVLIRKWAAVMELMRTRTEK